MSTPDFEIEIAAAGHDSIVAIKPPVNSAFREQIYDILDGLGLIKEIVVRDGEFFKTMHSRDGSPYSELRVSSEALAGAGVTLISLAHASRGVLEEQDKTATVTPFLKSGQNGRHLFSG